MATEQEEQEEFIREVNKQWKAARGSGQPPPLPGGPQFQTEHLKDGNR